MKRIKNIVIGGIQQKVFNLVLITIILMMAANTAVIFYQSGRLNGIVTETNDRQKESITEISQQTMDAVLNKSLTQSTQLEAALAGEFFDNAKNAVQILADYAEKLLNDPEAVEPREVFLPNPGKNGEITVQLLTEEGVDYRDPDIARELGLIGNMSDLMIALYGNANVDSCYVALPSGVMLLADDHSGSKFDESGALIPIPVRQRLWYQGAAETKGLYFTDVTTDIFSNQTGIMCALPVYRDGTLAAVVGADLFLDDMSAAVSSSTENGGFVCIINEKGHVVFSPQTEGTFGVQVAAEAADLRNSENRELADFVTQVLEKNTDVHLIDVDGENWYMAGAPIRNVGWAVVSAVEKNLTDEPAVMMANRYDGIQGEALETVLRGFSKTRTTIIVMMVVIIFLCLASALTLSKRIVKPLEAITNRVRSIGGDNLQFKMEPAFRTDDEIEVLAESFAMLSGKTIQYLNEVKQVTAEKERIETELQMARKIQESQLPRLYPAFPQIPEVDIIASMTPAKEVGGDFYDYFLVDDDHIGIVMADVSGKGVPAALFMMVSRVLIKSHLQNGESPAKALENVNNQLCEGNEAGFFVTVWLAVFEISTGKGIAVNAGHEHPILRRADGKYELISYRHSVAVAALEGIHFREREFVLNPGDSIFVYTDGVAEATNGENELYGTERLLEALNAEPDAKPEKILRNVKDSIDGFVAGAEQFDDITMLCMYYSGPGEKGKTGNK